MFPHSLLQATFAAAHSAGSSSSASGTSPPPQQQHSTVASVDNKPSAAELLGTVGQQMALGGQQQQQGQREPKPFKCPHCPKAFANNSYLSQHMRIHLGIRAFGPCQFCGKKAGFLEYFIA
jgi:hypothetical protein